LGESRLIEATRYELVTPASRIVVPQEQAFASMRSSSRKRNAFRMPREPNPMMQSRPSFRVTTNVEVLLNTLEHERHARGALLVAFASELRMVMTGRASAVARDLLAQAERGEMGDEEYRLLLAELRALVRAAA
jgi:hypothetical protein